MNNKKGKYNEEELEFLKINYPLYGPKYCGDILNRNHDNIYAQGNRMGLKKIGVNKHPSQQNVDPNQFYNIAKAEIAYFLGFLWADGYLVRYTNKTSNTYGVRMEINSEDANDIWDVMMSIGNWNIQKRKRKSTWKETTNFNVNSKDLLTFLEKHDYHIKSSEEPTSILSVIPDNLKPYWWRGFFDGDGYISFAEKGKGRWRSLGFSATFEYKWSELIRLSTELNIEKYIDYKAKPNSKGHSSSKFTINRISDMEKMVNYLLKSDLGLNRKTKKLKDFLSNINY
jgi:hypothetical protein